mmetsp:Transcript_13129/g.30807  ORF Transcript_13129/g.30807 Transcript_13129/m.30807 type:complete len:353 (+) Transcript_13129:66-1124(+)
MVRALVLAVSGLAFFRAQATPGLRDDSSTPCVARERLQEKDSCLLIQRDFDVRAADLPLEKASATPNDLLQNIVEAIPIIIQVNGSAPQGKSKQEPPGGMDMATMTKAISAMFEAVRSNDFMGNMTWLMKFTRMTCREFTDQGLIDLRSFLHRAEEKSDDELMLLLASYLNNGTYRALLLLDTLMGAYNSTKPAMPVELQEMLEPMLQSMSQNLRGGGKSEHILPVDATEREICKEAVGRFHNISGFKQEGAKMKGLVNSSKAMLPMLEEYLDGMGRSDVKARIMYLLNLNLDSMYDVANSMLELNTAILRKAPAALNPRIPCQLPTESSSTRPGLSFGLLVALIAAVLGRH